LHLIRPLCLHVNMIHIFSDMHPCISAICGPVEGHKEWGRHRGLVDDVQGGQGSTKVGRLVSVGKGSRVSTTSYSSGVSTGKVSMGQIRSWTKEIR
jgi:hypothetical protein